MCGTTLTLASKTKRSNIFPPMTDSPWDNDEDQVCPHGLLHPTGQILKDLEREIKTDEWKANAMKNNVFANCPMRKASSNEGDKLTSNRRCKKQVSSVPVAGVSAMTLKPVKCFCSS